MDRTRGRRQANHREAPLSLQAEVLVVYDSERRRRQLVAIREFLLALSDRVGERATSDTAVGVGTTDDGLEGLMGPLEAAVVLVAWAAKGPMSVRQMLQGLNEGRPTPLRYTTVQTVMARLARKRVLTRTRHGRRDLYRAVAPDAASIAVSRLLARFGEAAIRAFVEQVSREPRLRAALQAASAHLP